MKAQVLPAVVSPVLRPPLSCSCPSPLRDWEACSAAEKVDQINRCMPATAEKDKRATFTDGEVQESCVDLDIRIRSLIHLQRNLKSSSFFK